MKTVNKFLMFGALALMLMGINVTASFAQEDEEKTKLYTQFTACYKETDAAKRDACYAIGKQYLDKYEKGADGTVDQYGSFVRKKYDAYIAGKKTDEVFARFDKAIKDPKALNVDDAFASGKEIIAASPDLLDVPIVLASIGFDNAFATPPNDKYNADAVNYAKMVIDKINAGKTCDQCGAYAYAYKSTKYPDGKANALGYMNYYIGYIMYNRQNMKKEALPYFYKATQANSATKELSEVYRIIGSWYADEFLRLDNDRVAKVKAAGDQDTDETKAIFAMQKGYAERAADAYVRAYKVSPATAGNRDALLARAKQFYGIRFYNDPAKVDGYDAYATAATGKPFVDPTTAVTPVVEETPATPATTTGTTTGTAPATTTTTTTTKPATTTSPAMTKPATTTTPAKPTTTTTTKPATPAKPSATTTTKPASTTTASKKVSR